MSIIGDALTFLFRVVVVAIAIVCISFILAGLFV